MSEMNSRVEEMAEHIARPLRYIADEYGDHGERHELFADMVGEAAFKGALAMARAFLEEADRIIFEAAGNHRLGTEYYSGMVRLRADLRALFTPTEQKEQG